jgi:hypothetical protein
MGRKCVLGYEDANKVLRGISGSKKEEFAT